MQLFQLAQQKPNFTPMFRKFLADNLFTGHDLLTNNQLVLIVNTNGTIEGLVPFADVGDDIETIEGLLSPGFINAHCHLELSHLKGIIPEKTGMVDFIFGVLGNRAIIDNDHTAKMEADANMWANGIQAVGDICNTADTVSTKQKSPIFYHNFIEVSGFAPTLADARFAHGLAIKQAFNHHFPVGQTTITPHAPYSVSTDLFKKIANENPAIISVHNQECQAEDDFINTKSGDMLRLYETIGIDISFFAPQHKSSLQYMLPLLPKAAQKLWVHNCFTTQNDIDVLTANHQPSSANFFCLCPNANLYINNPLPNMEMLTHSGFQLCFGTDSLASNHQLSILEEMKTLQHFNPNITTETMLQWATINGAKALRLDHQFGSFMPGKTSGVIEINGLVNNNTLNNATIKRII